MAEPYETNSNASGTPRAWTGQAPAEATRDDNQPFSGHESRGDGKKIYGMRRSTVMMGLMFLVGVGWVANETRKTRNMDAIAEAPEDAIIAASVPLIEEYANLTTGDNASPVEAAGGVTDRPLYGSRLRFESNPFAHLTELPEPEPEPEPEPVIADPEPDPEPEPQAPPVDHLKLGLMGSRYVYINDRRVAVGDRIDGWTVKRIENDRVVLQWEDVEHILKQRR